MADSNLYRQITKLENQLERALFKNGNLQTKLKDIEKAMTDSGDAQAGYVYYLQSELKHHEDQHAYQTELIEQLVKKNEEYEIIIGNRKRTTV